LARAHSRSGELAVIAEYLGESDTFDKAIVDFSVPMLIKARRITKLGRRQCRQEKWSR
jgi:hypothetical protein